MGCGDVRRPGFIPVRNTSAFEMPDLLRPESLKIADIAGNFS